MRISNICEFNSMNQTVAGCRYVVFTHKSVRFEDVCRDALETLDRQPETNEFLAIP